eukprot:scaffold21903_cov116-Isochrysis_galbana.AAC.4
MGAAGAPLRKSGRGRECPRRWHGGGTPGVVATGRFAGRQSARHGRTPRHSATRRAGCPGGCGACAHSSRSGRPADRIRRRARAAAEPGAGRAGRIKSHTKSIRTVGQTAKKARLATMPSQSSTAARLTWMKRGAGAVDRKRIAARPMTTSAGSRSSWSYIQLPLSGIRAWCPSAAAAGGGGEMERRRPARDR